MNGFQHFWALVVGNFRFVHKPTDNDESLEFLGEVLIETLERLPPVYMVDVKSGKRIEGRFIARGEYVHSGNQGRTQSDT